VFVSTLILTLSSIVSRLIGALYKIPLNRRVPAHLIGTFGYAFPVYGLLYNVACLGMPGALLKLCSERLALGDGRSVRRVFALCFVALGLSSFGASALLYGVPKN